MKLLVESIQNIFAAGVTSIIFLGITLIILAWSLDESAWGPRAVIMLVLIGMIAVIWIIMLVFQAVKPSGLTGPPATTNNLVVNSAIIQPKTAVEAGQIPLIGVEEQRKTP